MNENKLTTNCGKLPKEFNLSEKIDLIDDENKWISHIHVADIKEFIRLLKEELKEITFVNQIPEFDEIVGDSIDKLAGDKFK